LGRIFNSSTMKANLTFLFMLGCLMLTSSQALIAQSKIIGISESGPLGSDYSGGLVWECSANGAEFKPIKKFDDLAIGRAPSIVFQGSDGHIYGVLKEGGPNGLGAVFRMNPDGTDFQHILPKSMYQLFEGSDGYLYGIRDAIYRLKNDGSQFWKISNNNGGNTDLVEASDGKLYFGGKSYLQVHAINKDGSDAEILSVPYAGGNDGGIRRWRIFAPSIDRLYVYRDYFTIISPTDPTSPYHFHHYVMTLDGQIIKSKASSEFFSYDYTAPVSEVIGIDHHLYRMNGREDTENIEYTHLPDFGCEGSTIGRTIRYTDIFGIFYGESSQNNQWDLFSWKPADSSCTIIRHWDESMGYSGKPQYQRIVTSGTSSIYQNISLGIFPNPNPGTFSVELPEPAQSCMNFRITDLAGRLVQEQAIEYGSKQQTVQAGLLPNGLYFLQVVADGKVLAVEKFVKQ